MKIKDNRNKPIEFSKLVIGDFFEYDDYIWIKYDMNCTADNSLNLYDCVMDSILPATIVVPIDVELVINK